MIMKNLFLILLSMGLIYGASAQKINSGGTYYSRPRVSISVGAYSPFYYPYYRYGYSPFAYGYGFGYGFPYYGYDRPYRPSKLDLKIEDIKKDYQDKIWSVRNDESLSGKEKRKEVRNLKQERDKVVLEARKDYYHAPKSN
jgi:hypothetical protein